MKRHAASSGGTGIDLTDEEPSLWAPPTLQEAEAAVRYTGDQPPDYEERLDMLRDLRVWRDVKRFITAIGEEGDDDDDDRRAKAALHVVEQQWLREWLYLPASKWVNFRTRRDTAALPSCCEYRDAMVIEIDTWWKCKPEKQPLLAVYIDAARREVECRHRAGRRMANSSTAAEFLRAL